MQVANKVRNNTWKEPGHLVMCFITHRQHSRERKVCPHDAVLNVSLMPSELVCNHVVFVANLGTAAKHGRALECVQRNVVYVDIRVLNLDQGDVHWCSDRMSIRNTALQLSWSDVDEVVIVAVYKVTQLISCDIRLDYVEVVLSASPAFLECTSLQQVFDGAWKVLLVRMKGDRRAVASYECELVTIGHHPLPCTCCAVCTLLTATERC